MPDLELEPEEHIYRLGGVEIPGCTNVLTAVGAAPSFWFLTAEELQFYRDRGKAVHRAVELTIRGTLDRRLPEWIKPYLIGWERFMNDYNVEVINVPGKGLPSAPFVETPLHHGSLRYGVMPDVVAHVKRSANPRPIELKATSAHSAATQIQTAAQDLAVEDALGCKLDGPRYACRLLPEEPYYDPMEYKERGDRSTWIGMLSTFNWLTRHNPRALRSNP